MRKVESAKVRENRARRMAERQGYVVQKSRRRDPLALDYGVYRLVNADGNYLVMEGDLDQVEQWLTGDR